MKTGKSTFVLLFGVNGRDRGRKEETGCSFAISDVAVIFGGGILLIGLLVSGAGTSPFALLSTKAAASASETSTAAGLG